MSVSVSRTALFYTLSMETSRAFSTILGNLEKKTQKISCQPNNSSSRQLNIHAEENLITSVSDLVASDETDEDNNEHSQESSRIRKTKSKTKVHVLEHFTRQSNGEIACNLCPNSWKVIFIFLL